MHSFKRIAVLDRSRLSRNIFEMILKPLGYSLFFYKNFRDLKERGSLGIRCGALLINANVFGSNREDHTRWLQEDSGLEETEKIFFCNAGDKIFQEELRKIKKSRVMTKPFYPPELEKMLDGVFK